MSFVMYVPGLQGDNQLKPANDPLPPGMTVRRSLDIPEGTYAAEVKKATEARGHGFLMAAYQTVADKWPTLSQMGRNVARQYLAATHGQPTGTENVIVGSSVGAGVVIQALGLIRGVVARNNAQSVNMEEMSAGTIRPVYDRMPHVIMLEGVYDPLAAIDMQVAHLQKQPGMTPKKAAQLTELYERLVEDRTNDNEYFPLPVEPNATDNNPGYFHLQSRHVNDPRAIKVLSNARDRNNFVDKIAPSLPSLHFITSEGHRLSPPLLARTFADACCITTPPTVEVWDRSKLGMPPEAHMGKRTGEILADLGL